MPGRGEPRRAAAIERRLERRAAHARARGDCAELFEVAESARALVLSVPGRGWEWSLFALTCAGGSDGLDWPAAGEGPERAGRRAAGPGALRDRFLPLGQHQDAYLRAAYRQFLFAGGVPSRLPELLQEHLDHPSPELKVCVMSDEDEGGRPRVHEPGGPDLDESRCLPDEAAATYLLVERWGCTRGELSGDDGWWSFDHIPARAALSLVVGGSEYAPALLPIRASMPGEGSRTVVLALPPREPGESDPAKLFEEHCKAPQESTPSEDPSAGLIPVEEQGESAPSGTLQGAPLVLEGLPAGSMLSVIAREGRPQGLAAGTPTGSGSCWDDDPVLQRALFDLPERPTGRPSRLSLQPTEETTGTSRYRFGLEMHPATGSLCIWVSHPGLGSLRQEAEIGVGARTIALDWKAFSSLDRRRQAHRRLATRNGVFLAGSTLSSVLTGIAIGIAVQMEQTRHQALALKPDQDHDEIARLERQYDETTLPMVATASAALFAWTATFSVTFLVDW